MRRNAWKRRDRFNKQNTAHKTTNPDTNTNTHIHTPTYGCTVCGTTLWSLPMLSGTSLKNLWPPQKIYSPQPQAKAGVSRMSSCLKPAAHQSWYSCGTVCVQVRGQRQAFLNLMSQSNKHFWIFIWAFGCLSVVINNCLLLK